MTSAGRSVGYVLIGAGRAGAFHISAISRMPGCSLRYLVDVDADRAASRTNEYNQEQGGECVALAATEVGRCLSDPKVDAVIVASVTYSHYDYIKAALSAGKAVYTEKPISHNSTEIAEIVDMAERLGLVFMVGYQRRIDKNFLELHRQCSIGALGPLRMIKCCSRDNPLPPLEYLRVSGGIFYDMLTHDIDMMHWLSGGQIPVEVHSVGHCYNRDIAAMHDLDTVAVTFKYASGLIAIADVSRVAEYGYDQRVEVLGELGMATAHNVLENTVVVSTLVGHVAPRAQWSFPQRYEHAYPANLARFNLLVRSGQPEASTIVRRHIALERVTAAAELSWRLGRVVRISEVESLREHLQHHTTEHAAGHLAATVSKLPVAKL